MKEPILITGAARSGTSLVAGSIFRCNAFGGVMRGANSNNRKGMYENVRVVQTLVKPYFESIRVDRLGQYPLPDIHNLPIPSDWRQKVQKVFMDEGYKEGPWFYKGAKMCLMWPIWFHSFPDAKWIIVRRKPSDIAHSCCKTAFMSAYRKSFIQRAVKVSSEFDGWLWWERQHRNRFVEMIENGLNCKVIWPDRMVRGDYRQLYDVVEWLGLEWNEKAIIEFVDPKLWKARKGVHAHG